MWNYIRSKLTDMPHIIFGMDFTQAFNPLYALPIVAVIVCAFLVYAFGFRSPVQPPSFEEIEVDKKAVKKRKAKENQKSKQNGKSSGSTGKNVDSITSEKKKKVEKQPAADKHTPKPEAKVVKKGNAPERKKKPSVSHELDLIEDGSEEGWVHHISKKGRKNRKKDDTGLADAAILSAPCHSTATEVFTSLPENTLEEKHVNENNDEFTAVDEDVSDKVPVKEICPTKLKKQKKKDKETADKESMNAIDAISAEVICQETDVSVPNPQECVQDGNETIKVSREKKNTKKKKKKQASNDKEVDMDEKSAVNVANQSCVTKNNAMLPSTDFEKDSDVKDLSDKTEKSNIHEIVSSVAVEGGKEANCSNAPIEAKGTNVAFDELEGLYPESKPLKKKKKVRRDH